MKGSWLYYDAMNEEGVGGRSQFRWKCHIAKPPEHPERWRISRVHPVIIESVL